MAEALDSEARGDQQPDASPQGASSRATVIAVCLAAMAVIGAATAYSLPRFGALFSLSDFSQFSLPSVDRFSLPDLSRFSSPSSKRVAATPPPISAPVLVPDPVVRAGLRDIQTSQEQNADALMSLIQGSAAQQADLKRVTRQLALLTAQVSSLQNQAPQLTTSSIPPSTFSGMPRPNPRTRIVRASRKVAPPVLPAIPPAVIPAATPPSLPKPAGPVSVGGAPLSPAPGASAS